MEVQQLGHPAIFAERDDWMGAQPLAEGWGLSTLELVGAAEAWVHSLAAGQNLSVLKFPTCKTVHADTGRFVLKPHISHVCQRCGEVLGEVPSMVGISNPFAGASGWLVQAGKVCHSSAS